MDPMTLKAIMMGAQALTSKDKEEEKKPFEQVGAGTQGLLEASPTPALNLPTMSKATVPQVDSSNDSAAFANLLGMLKRTPKEEEQDRMMAGMQTGASTKNLA